ncbi:cytochrome c [Tumidithrix elongata RA019]|uniref:Cytochrome c n=1 Tax=Tumidithrix elongata BACA0141 TaxID=2716417 RepID=A0AAW9PT57_9CYAN|nr:cytochrome c [Tumidithrix elongata RA019]
MSNDGLNSATVAQPESARSPQQRPHQGLVILGIALVLIAIVLMVWLFRPHTDPYTESVLQLDGDANNGRSMFVMNCVACHGQWAAGEVGPSLRGVSERLSRSQLIHQVVSGETPPMPKFQPEARQMADLLSYLEQL